jgi:hypothetical protein
MLFRLVPATIFDIDLPEPEPFGGRPTRGL